jgi:1-phosphofructokinase
MRKVAETGMIYTVTFNPAVDCVINTEAIQIGETNRAKGENILFGGKGINVSVMLKHLGIESTALGFIAGFTGDAIKGWLDKENIKNEFIRLDDGNTRINVKLVECRRETEINGKGPYIGEKYSNAFLRTLDNIQEGDSLIISGNVPDSLPKNYFSDIFNRIRDKKCKISIDTSGKCLLDILKYQPFLIKPNINELRELSETKIRKPSEVIKGAYYLKESGAKNVLVSMGEDGALLVDDNNEVFYAGAPKGNLVSSSGAGDSMLAGFIAGLNRTGKYEIALKTAVAAGSATAFSDGIGSDIFVKELMTKIMVVKTDEVSADKIISLEK